MRYDIEYTDICVCSPEALCLFTDEFDWVDMHKDFVPGVLTSEILSYQIYTHVSSGYAGVHHRDFPVVCVHVHVLSHVFDNGCGFGHGSVCEKTHSEACWIQKFMRPDPRAHILEHSGYLCVWRFTFGV